MVSKCTWGELCATDPLGKSEDREECREGQKKGTGGLSEQDPWRWPDLAAEVSYLAWTGLSFLPVIVISNIVEKLGNTFFPLKNELSGQTHI